ncbi:hypothetical protein SKA34_06860 [Photobacterium sp. SKA34]|uniref:hypothetical protein n=1 Tax=Photobacterium sp. SKA34 TaxID=121723 RepID=UPI00006AEAAE|nr:hypothetical protein [Photobacterium sp. SKA34]EAR57458.1 hypothetical protein SKA34_06860 [Photobacterium sp. SKA34]
MLMINIPSKILIEIEDIFCQLELSKKKEYSEEKELVCKLQLLIDKANDNYIPIDFAIELKDEIEQQSLRYIDNQQLCIALTKISHLLSTTIDEELLCHKFRNDNSYKILSTYTDISLIAIGVLSAFFLYQNAFNIKSLYSVNLTSLIVLLLWFVILKATMYFLDRDQKTIIQHHLRLDHIDKFKAT